MGNQSFRSTQKQLKNLRYICHILFKLCDGDNVSHLLVHRVMRHQMCTKQYTKHKTVCIIQEFSARVDQPMTCFPLFLLIPYYLFSYPLLCNIPQRVQLCHNMTPLRTAFKCNKSSILLYHLYDQLFMFTFSNLMSPDTVYRLYEYIQ